MYDDAFTVAFIWCFVVLCPVVLHVDTLSFHTTFFINSSLICANVYMLKHYLAPPFPLWLYQKINKQINK